jgi:hypothetical protein
MKRFVFAVAILCALPGNLVAAEPESGGGLFQGTPAEQKACSRDATRLCSEEIPDTFAVLACLQKNRAKLHKSCVAVLEAHGQ